MRCVLEYTKKNRKCERSTKRYVFGVGTKPKKTQQNGGAHFSVNIVIFQSSHCIFERVMGVTEWNIFESNIDGEMCTKKWVIFINFVTFTSNLVYSVVWNQSEWPTILNDFSEERNNRNLSNKTLDILWYTLDPLNKCKDAQNMDGSPNIFSERPRGISRRAAWRNKTLDKSRIPIQQNWIVWGVYD